MHSEQNQQLLFTVYAIWFTYQALYNLTNPIGFVIRTMQSHFSALALEEYEAEIRFWHNQGMHYVSGECGLSAGKEMA